MAAILHLDDGRTFHAPNRGISGAYELIGLQVAARPRLRHWLVDRSFQCAPFFDIDTRGFEPEDREEFWAAARRALDAVIARHGPEILASDNSPAAYCLNRLVAEKEKIERGEASGGPTREDVEPVVLDGIWYSEEELGALLDAY